MTWVDYGAHSSCYEDTKYRNRSGSHRRRSSSESSADSIKHKESNRRSHSSRTLANKYSKKKRALR
ncbi:hypothetical protein NQ314_011341 [Rhamnusium bicolor]|uniref:Uncharacterized protein n=1 Tax=Rhamnusium bicolor TaxID=1586634 RepID=A0AAV8XL48_9CUCU|nr:hypothetical protein NQ314_011341 [Rhamnusium bicolor]